MEKIISKDNKLIKHIKKLQSKKYRDEFNEFVVEGIKMVREAICEKAKIKNIVICEDVEFENLESYNCVVVPQNIFDSISNVATPQGVLAVIEKNVENKINFENEIFLVLDGVQDPGNLGTILRTADGVGIKQIVVSKETADCYNPKVVRSTMGAIFRIEIIETSNLQKTLDEFKSHNFQTIVTTPIAQKTIYDINYEKSVIIVGNEANGVSKDIIKNSSNQVKIPMLGKTESLNVSVATGIILYEYVRQKNLKN